MQVNSTPASSDTERMPFAEEFWVADKTSQRGNSDEMKNIKGYFTALPVHWTEGENNLLPYNMRLIADNNKHDNPDIQLADNSDENNIHGALS